MSDFNYQKIFHPTDLTRGDEAAFAHALKIAHQAKSLLTIFHLDTFDEDAGWEEFPHVRNLLERWGVIPQGSTPQAVLDSGVQVKKIEAKGSAPVHPILHYLETHKNELIVLSTHQRQGLSRWTHEAIAEPVGRESHVATLFVPRRAVGFVSVETGAVSLENILIPIDRKPHPQRAIDAAVALARILDCPKVNFQLLHVGSKATCPNVAVPLQTGWQVQEIIKEGDAVETILDEEEFAYADLLVMATEGHKGFLDALRGSTTERVLRGSQCPLLAVPAV
ncbi:MAG: universal stress protein [Acidobacteriota bacterium]